MLLVRHGQASFGADDYDVLSATGWAQSRVLGRFLRDLTPGAVLHGDMRRQRETAEAMTEGAGWDVVPEVDPGWNEFDHIGVISRAPELAAELSDRRAFQRAFVEATARWSGGAHDDEYDETWVAFVTRIRGALDRTCARNGVSVVSSSGGPIAVACATLVDPEASADELPRLWNAFNTVSANAAVTRVLVGSTGRRMLTFNEHTHLPRDLVTYR
ncbi:MAG: histidine phosphatase family protein [Nocardioides sp.]